LRYSSATWTDLAPVLRGVGFLLHTPAAMALVSMAVCLLADEPYGLTGFAAVAAVTVVPGQAMLWTTRQAPPMQRFHAMRIAAIAWLLISMAGLLPFVISAHLAPAGGARAAMQAFRDPVMALFESVSGFSSTGLTVAPSAAALPAHIQWWRSFTEWVGGIGVILLLLTVLPAERSSLNLYFSEAREEKILPTVKSTVRAIWIIYIGYTAVSVCLLWLTGEPAWQALNHAMTAISTGGFSITDDSLASSPPLAQAIYLPLMVLGATSFATHYRLLRERRVLATLRDSPELKLFAFLLAAGTVAVTLERWHFAGIIDPFTAALQWVSALTTTGFSSDTVANWEPATLLLLVFAMIIGAMGGSTGSGIKQARLAILMRDLAWNLRSFRSTRHEVVRIAFGARRLSPDAMSTLALNAALLCAAYLLVWVAGVMILLHVVPADTPLEHVFFEAASAQGNVGLSTGITGAHMSTPAALVLIVLMLAGRLEIFPIIVLLAWILRQR